MNKNKSFYYYVSKNNFSEYKKPSLEQAKEAWLTYLKFIGKK
jgi:hypothetical protein